MTVTTATKLDWVDFWENEMPTEPIVMTPKELRELRDSIIECIEVAFSVWGDDEGLRFEERAICGIVSDCFVDRGIL